MKIELDTEFGWGVWNGPKIKWCQRRDIQKKKLQRNEASKSCNFKELGAGLIFIVFDTARALFCAWKPFCIR
jgi:hypothetical protein